MIIHNIPDQQLTLRSGHRRRILLPIRPLLRHDLRKSQETRETLGIQPRVPPPATSMRHRPLPHNKSILARMVRQTHRPLGRSRALRIRVRPRIPVPLHLASDLCHGRIRDLLRERIGRIRYYAEYCWSAAPSRCGAPLCEVWRFVGYFGSWICEPGLSSYSVCAVVFWAVGKEEVSILSAVVGGGNVQSREWNQDA